MKLQKCILALRLVFDIISYSNFVFNAIYTFDESTSSFALLFNKSNINLIVLRSDLYRFTRRNMLFCL